MARASSKLKINEAELGELCLLPDIGMGRAKRLLEVKRRYGSITPAILDTILPQGLTPSLEELLDFSPPVKREGVEQEEETERKYTLGDPRGQEEEWHLGRTFRIPGETAADRGSFEAIQGQELTDSQTYSLDLQDLPSVPSRLPGVRDIPNPERRAPSFRAGSPEPRYRASRTQFVYQERVPEQDMGRGEYRTYRPLSQEVDERDWTLKHPVLGPMIQLDCADDDLSARRNPKVRAQRQRPVMTSHEQRGNPDRLPKNLHFMGTSNWFSFKQKFTTYQSVLGWTDSECKDYLLWSLEGKALDFVTVRMSSVSNYTFTEMMRQLESRFGAAELVETTRAKFQNATQKADESLDDWADRVLTLASHAYQGLPERFSQSESVNRFCQGCVDKEAGKFACLQKPDSVERALNLIKQYQQTSVAMNPRRRREETLQICTTELDLKKMVADEVASQMALLRRDLMKEMREMREELQSSRPLCYHCHRKGHVKKNCPHLDTTPKSNLNG